VLLGVGRLKDVVCLKKLYSLLEVKGDIGRKYLLFADKFVLCYKQVFSLYDVGVEDSDFAPKKAGPTLQRMSGQA
jgi:hypothetical protein